MIPGAPFSTRQQVTENYRNVFRTLSRFEDTGVVILSYPGLGAHARKGNAPQQRKIFFGEMKSDAQNLHYTWIDGVELFAASGGQRKVKVDGLHFNAGGHELMAVAIEVAILAGSKVDA